MKMENKIDIHCTIQIWNGDMETKINFAEKTVLL